jgi:hypothetical protein
MWQQAGSPAIWGGRRRATTDRTCDSSGTCPLTRSQARPEPVGPAEMSLRRRRSLTQPWCRQSKPWWVRLGFQQSGGGLVPPSLGSPRRWGG